jgi:hypothetical protein
MAMVGRVVLGYNGCMTVSEQIIAKVRSLSAQDQQRLLEFITSLPSVTSNQFPTTNGSAEDSLGTKLAAMGTAAEQIATELPTDLAANHDFYLHGLRKRS